jgi:hypothetical protein
MGLHRRPAVRQKLFLIHTGLQPGGQRAPKSDKNPKEEMSGDALVSIAATPAKFGLTFLSFS